MPAVLRRLLAPDIGQILDHLDQAEAAAGHLYGLFTLCQFLREDASFAERDALHTRYNKLTDALNQVGELGAAIADSIVGCVCEAQDKVLDLMPIPATGTVEGEHNQSKNK